MSELNKTFIDLCSKYTNNNNLINELWVEIENNYSDKKRHYHTLEHLENLLFQLSEIKTEINNWDSILFTLFYHDIIYNPLNSDNEEKSAGLAEKRMKQINVNNETLESCKLQIISTKSHFRSSDSDINYFLDADLSVLGQDWNTYSVYCKNVRKEYSIFPDFIYKSGRKKVLSHFLSMDRIFKTEYFYNKFESKAKENILHEIKVL